MPLPTPRPPGPDGNPPPYDAMKDLAERCASATGELNLLKAELERVQKREAACLDAIRKRFPKLMASNANGLAFHVEQGEAFAGIGSEALTRWLRSVSGYCEELAAALQPDAGSDYISKDAVKPLVEALRHVSTDDRYPHPVVLKAIEHAKSLGL